MLSSQLSGSKMFEMTEKKSSLIPMAALVLLLLGGVNVNGLASHTRMHSKYKLSSHQQRHYPLTSLPLSYAIDSTRMGAGVHASIPQNMTLLPAMQSSVTATTTTTRNDILSNTWRKLKDATKFDRKAIAKMGIDFGLTYNMISNINGSFTLSAAWYISSMKVRQNKSYRYVVEVKM
jgi:hypothetical protein